MGWKTENKLCALMWAEKVLTIWTLTNGLGEDRVEDGANIWTITLTTAFEAHFGATPSSM